MAPLRFRFFALVLVLVLLLARETSSHLSSSSSVNNSSSMVMWQNVPVETVVASHLQIVVTRNSSKGVQKFHTTLHRNSDYPRETLASKGYNFPFKFRKNKFVALENGNKATFDCQVELPFIGYTKPWIELDTGNIYCIFFPYTKKLIPPPHHTSLKEAPHVSAPSFALLLGRLSVSGTGNMMNITSEVNNVIISILENSDVQIHWRKNDYLSMSLWEDFGISQSEVKEQNVKNQIIVTLSAGQCVEMIICYEMDESQIPPMDHMMIIAIIAFIFVIFMIYLIIIDKIISKTVANTFDAGEIKRALYNINKLASEMICCIEKDTSEV